MFNIMNRIIKIRDVYYEVRVNELDDFIPSDKNKRVIMAKSKKKPSKLKKSSGY